MMPENKKSRKPRKIKAFGVVCGVPARIRTGGVPLRRRTLYPAEVQRHLAICGYFYSTHLPPFCERREVEQTLRRRTLYPAELRGQMAIFYYFAEYSELFYRFPFSVIPDSAEFHFRQKVRIFTVSIFRTFSKGDRSNYHLGSGRSILLRYRCRSPQGCGGSVF